MVKYSALFLALLLDWLRNFWVWSMSTHLPLSAHTSSPKCVEETMMVTTAKKSLIKSVGVCLILAKQPTFRDTIPAFTREMASDERLQKFHADDVWLPRSWSAVLLIGWRAPPVRSTARSRYWCVISMEFLWSFLRFHFTGKPGVVSRNVGCFLRLLKLNDHHCKSLLIFCQMYNFWGSVILAKSNLDRGLGNLWTSRSLP